VRSGSSPLTIADGGNMHYWIALRRGIEVVGRFATAKEAKAAVDEIPLG
jgi:hypothetical protein